MPIMADKACAADDRRQWHDTPAAGLPRSSPTSSAQAPIIGGTISISMMPLLLMEMSIVIDPNMQHKHHFRQDGFHIAGEHL